MPQAEGTSESAEDTAKKCLDIFSGIGANVSEFDVDTAHRVPTSNQNDRSRATGRPFPIICKFTWHIARDGVLAKRREISNSKASEKAT